VTRDRLASLHGTGQARLVARGSSRATLIFALCAALALMAAGWAGYGSNGSLRGVKRRVTDMVVLLRVEAFANEIEFAARESGLDPCLLAAMVYCESSGRPDAVSKADALGLMQLLPDAAGDAARRLGLEEPSREELLEDAGLNLRLGAAHFAWTLANEGGDLERGLVAYNAGRARLRRWIREAGSYSAWRSGRQRAGNSPVLNYARRILDYTVTFCDRGSLACEPSSANPLAPPNPANQTTPDD